MISQEEYYRWRYSVIAELDLYLDDPARSQDDHVVFGTVMDLVRESNHKHPAWEGLIQNVIARTKLDKNAVYKVFRDHREWRQDNAG